MAIPLLWILMTVGDWASADDGPFLLELWHFWPHQVDLSHRGDLDGVDVRL